MRVTISNAMLGVIAAVVLAVSLVASAAAEQHGAGKISGQVIEITPDGRLVVAEQGPWKGPGTGVITHTIAVTSDTPIRAVRPTGLWESDTSPGWEIRPVSIRDLKPGDFVTVVTDAARRRAMALEVVRPADNGGSALPGARR